ATVVFGLVVDIRSRHQYFPRSSVVPRETVASALVLSYREKPDTVSTDIGPQQSTKRRVIRVWDDRRGAGSLRDRRLQSETPSRHEIKDVQEPWSQRGSIGAAGIDQKFADL